MSQNNANRIARANTALAGYRDDFDPSANLTDLLTDLRHLADRDKLDFEDCLRLSAMHFAEECQEASS